jgi:hypothetical protein
MRVKSFLYGFLVFMLILSMGCGQAKEEETTKKQEFLSKESEAIVKMKYTSAMSDLKAIGAAIESYMVDNSDAPNVGTLAELQAQLVPYHIRVMPITDPWGNEYIYKYLGKEEYAIACAGSDGKFKGFDQRGEYTGLKENDIIYSNGQFVYVAVQ